MANPISDDKLLEILKAEGVKLSEWKGYDAARGKQVTWRDHDRNPVNSAWGPINGIMVHHTGSDAQGSNYINNILWPGYSGLPGPLCHFGIGMDGTVYLISNGRANHAGGGDSAVLSAVQAEASWLMEREAKPTVGNSNGVDGNRHFYGLEVMYDGGQPMTAAQEDATIRVCAAIARYYGWTERSVIGHREWSRDKSDPGNENMVTMRKNIGARIRSGSGTGGGAGTQPPATNKPAPTPTPNPSPTTPTGGKVSVSNFKDGRTFDNKVLKANTWNNVSLCAKSDLIWAWNDSVWVNGGVALDVEMPEDAYLVAQLYAVDSTKRTEQGGYPTVYNWAPVGFTRMHELYVPFNTVVWPQHKVGLVVYPSVDMKIKSSRLEVNVFRNV